MRTLRGPRNGETASQSESDHADDDVASGSGEDNEVSSAQHSDLDDGDAEDEGDDNVDLKTKAKLSNVGKKVKKIVIRNFGKKVSVNGLPKSKSDAKEAPKEKHSSESEEDEPLPEKERKDEEVSGSEEDQPLPEKERKKEKKTKAAKITKNSGITKSEESQSEQTEKKGKKEKTSKKKDDEYEVEQVVDMETKLRWNCPVKFRVRWLGYSEKDDSWLFASDLDCDVVIQDFLEISGRKSEYEKILKQKEEARAAAASVRASSRVTSSKFKIEYSELDDDQEEVIPSGTRTRKPIKRKQEYTPAALKKMKKVLSEKEYEVESIVKHRSGSHGTEYKVRWVGYSSKDDTWEAEADLHCKSVLIKYNSQLELEEESDDEYQVESINSDRDRNGIVEYRVRWKGFGSKSDTWEPEENLVSCKNIFAEYLAQHGKTPKTVTKKQTPVKKKSTKKSTPAKKRRRSINGTSQSDEEDENLEDNIPSTPKSSKSKKSLHVSFEENEDPAKVEQQPSAKKSKKPKSTPVVRTPRAGRGAKNVSYTDNNENED